MKLFRSQAVSILNSDKFLNFWIGPVRSGKTIASIFRWITFVSEYSGTNSLIMIGKTQQTLYRNVIKIIEELIGKNCYYSSYKNEFKIFDKICYTIGANDSAAEGKIRGFSAGGAYGDEVVLWPYNCFQMLISRLSEAGSKAFFTSNPDSPMHPIKVEYLDKKDSLDMSLFEFTFDENVFIAQDFKEQLKKIYTGLWYRRFILGQWCLAEGAIIDFFDEEEHTLTKCPKAKYYNLAIDYGANNPFCALLIGHNNETRPKVWPQHEFYHDGKLSGTRTNSEYADMLERFCKSNLGENWRNYVNKTIIDPSAESFQIELEGKYFPGVTHANNAVLDGILFTCSLLKSGVLAFSNTCTNLIKETYSYTWDANAQKHGVDAPVKVNDHVIDALRYGVYTELGGSNVDLISLTKW